MKILDDRSVMEQPFMSVIIPTFNRNSIILLLNKLFSQTYEKYEIVIVDQSTKSIEEKDMFIRNNLYRIRYFRIRTRGLTRARNFGLKHTKGDIVLFLDDDTVPSPDLLKTHVEAHACLQVGAVVGGIIESCCKPEPILPVGKITVFGRPVGNFNSTIKTFIQTAGGGNFSVKNSVIKQVGLFDTNLIGGSEPMEDADYSFRIRRLGYKILFEPYAAVSHISQADGNFSLIKTKRIQWYLNYFHNLMLFFLKNEKKIYLSLMLGTCFLISVKQVVLYTHKISHIPLLMKALWQGFLAYRREKRCNSPFLKP